MTAGKAVGPRFLLAAPYPEGAVVELSKRLSDRGIDPTLVLPSRGLSLKAVRLLPSRAKRLSERLTRGAVDDIGTKRIGRWLELVRLVARLPLVRTYLPGTIDVMKARYDQSLAKAPFIIGADAVLGMPAACLEVFGALPNSLKVFHAVDGHPEAVNRYLRQAYGFRARREFVPKRRARRISQELELADIVLVPSRLVAGQMVEAGVDEHKLRVVPYGVDPDRFRAQPREHVVRRRPLVLFVGQLSRRKGIPTLAAAVADADVDLLLVGPVVDARLLRLLPQNASHRNAVAPSELRDLFNSADAFVLPSIEDSFGLVVMEALLCGLPVISTNAAGASEVLEPTDGTVVTAGDVPALRAALNAVVALSADERLSRAARTRAEVNKGRLLDWNGYADEVAGLIATSLEDRTS